MARVKHFLEDNNGKLINIESINMLNKITYSFGNSTKVNCEYEIEHSINRVKCALSHLAEFNELAFIRMDINSLCRFFHNSIHEYVELNPLWESTLYETKNNPNSFEQLELVINDGCCPIKDNFVTFCNINCNKLIALGLIEKQYNI